MEYGQNKDLTSTHDFYGQNESKISLSSMLSAGLKANGSTQRETYSNITQIGTWSYFQNKY